MATGNGSTSSALQPHGQPPPPSQPQSPPSKRDLASWWFKFKKTNKKEEEKGNADPQPDRFKIIFRYPTFAFPGRFREIDSDNIHPRDILEFASTQGGSGTPDLDSLISEHDLPLSGGTGCGRDFLRCWFSKHRGHSVTSPSGHQQGRDGYQTFRSSTFGRSKLRSSTLVSPAVVEKPFSRAPWSLFTHKKSEAVEPPNGIFGVPLQVSIKYANVAISLTDGDGKSFIYGYVPIVVAKCGVFLKEKATDIEGIFRLSGSSKRIKDLQAIFNSPDRYGKGLDWTGYTVHDAANILRRYLNQLPEPIIPLEFYDRFRDPIRNHAMQAVGDTEAQASDVGNFDEAAAIRVYQQLIKQLPPLNRQLLLYILDLLAVFASKSDLNRMTSANLSAIFQPGLLSHPAHDMSPAEYRLSQDVLIFLIENQDHFLIGMTGTAADERTVQDVHAGNTPSTPQHGRSRGGVARSSSNASAGAEDVRKFGGIRRNVSVSSKHSRHSNGNAPSPAGTPHPGSTPTIGVHRSNTVPSKKSPALSSARFNKPVDSPVLASTGMTQLEVPPSPASAQSKPPVTAAAKPSDETIIDVKAPAATPSITPTGQEPAKQPNQTAAAEDNLPKTENNNEKHSLGALPSNSRGEPALTTPSKDRNLASFFVRTPTSDNEKKDSKAPNKLRKKKIPGSTNPSAQSSSTSLGRRSADSPTNQATHPPLPSPPAVQSYQQHQPQLNTVAPSPPEFMNTQATPLSEVPPAAPLPGKNSTVTQSDQFAPQQSSESTLKPAMSPTPSNHSRSSMTSHSDLDHGEETLPKVEKKKRQSRWRYSSQKPPQQQPRASSSSTAIGTNGGAEKSNTSIGSGSRQRKSLLNDPQHGVDPSIGFPPTLHQSHSESEAMAGANQAEKKSPLGWIKAKMNDRREEKREREIEKERAKSPPPPGGDNLGQRKSLQVSREGLFHRGRSVDIKREEEGERRPSGGGETSTPN